MIDNNDEVLSQYITEEHEVYQSFVTGCSLIASFLTVSATLSCEEFTA